MDQKSVDLEALPKPVREILDKLDPALIGSILNSMSGEDTDSLVTSAMGYVKQMPTKDKEAIQIMLQAFLQNDQ